MTKCLITGISGSAGSFLGEYLSKGVTTSDTLFEVHGTSRTAREHKDYKIWQCDLTDYSSVLRLILDVRPDYVFNLAANADVRDSFRNPLAILNNNINSTANLLEAIRFARDEYLIDPKIVHCSTSEVYGIIKEEDCPVDENYPINPVNVYGVSKLTQERLALAYHKMYGLKIINTRAWGYINPRRSNIFSTAFAKQIVEIERGKRNYLRHGNIKSVRTLADVRDIARGYWYAASQGDLGETYHVGSTQPISVEQFLHLLIKKTDVSIYTEEDKELLRPVDISYQVPCTKKFMARTGWSPQYTLDESINWLLESIRNE